MFGSFLIDKKKIVNYLLGEINGLEIHDMIIQMPVEKRKKFQKTNSERGKQSSCKRKTYENKTKN